MGDQGDDQQALEEDQRAGGRLIDREQAVIRAGRAGENNQERQAAENGVGDGYEFEKTVGQPARQSQVGHRGNAADRGLRQQQKERERQRQHRHALVAAGDRTGIQQGHTRRYRLGK